MNTLDRFEGNVAWSRLDDLQRVAIGSVALELLAAWWAQEQAADPMDGSDPLMRAADAADLKLMRMFQELMVEAIPRDMLEIDGHPRLPSLLGRVCRFCGCTDDDACPGRCSWVEDDRCSSCAAALPDDNSCPGHVAGAHDPKICGRCGVHIDELRPDDVDPVNLQGSGPAPIEPRED